MANEVFKQIKTKIALKQQTYAEWTANTDTGANYIPLYGEVCFCEIPAAPTEGNTEATTAPTVLFKVGTAKRNEDGSYVAGTNKKFSELKWASALAADVYEWAKLPWDDFEARILPIIRDTIVAGAELDETVAGNVKTINHETKLAGGFTGSATAGSATAAGSTVTIKVPKLTVNEYGHVTGATDVSYTITIPEAAAVNDGKLTLRAGGGLSPIEKEFTANDVDDVTFEVSHGAKPTTGSAHAATAGTGRTYVTKVDVDTYGHIAKVYTATETDQDLSGYKVKQTAVDDTAVTGKYISEIDQDENGVITIKRDNLPTIPGITITDDTAAETPTTDTVAVYKNLTASGHTLTEELVNVPTKAYVDKMAAGAVDYLGTLAAATGLSTTAKKGDFYRVTTEIKSGSTVLAFVGDIVIAEKDNPTQAIDGTNWTAIHCGDGDISNVAAGSGLTGGGATGSVTLNVGAGNGISVTADAVSVKAGDGITVDTNGVHHADTSNQTSVTANGRKYITGVTLDAYGHVTGLTTGTETVIDTDTHYEAKNIVGASATAKANAAVAEATNSIYLNLVENDAVRSAINIVGAGATKVYSDANGKITIKSTDTNTWRGINVFAGVEGSKASVALKGTETTTGAINFKAGTGLKWTATAASNDATVDIDDTVTFILDCN